MKLLILSDLHLEFNAFKLPEGLDFDVAILAGDIHAPGSRGIAWARDPAQFGTTTPIIIVPGNHEYYRTVMATERRLMQKTAASTNVRMLDGDETVIEGVRFLGCTLWTDFALRIDVPSADGEVQAISDPPKAQGQVEGQLNDYRVIKVEEGKARPDPTNWWALSSERPLRGSETLAIHKRQRAWLKRKLSEPFDGRTVVVTHHAPHRGSLATMYARDWLSAGFVSELPAEFFKVPALWIHGHVHQSYDYQVGNCRVLANPRGYVLNTGELENSSFNPGLVVNV